MTPSALPRLFVATLACALFSISSSSLAQTRIPLPDLGTGSYLGNQGGLYPGGTNVPPGPHAAAALAQAAFVVPRDAAGVPSADGLIGFACLGMSNSSQEFEDLERALDADPARNAHVVVVNTCAGGQAAESMDEAADLYWTTLAPGRLASAGIDPDQVQVAWLKQAYLAVPTSAFPAHAVALRDTLGALVRVARARYPNLRIVYVSSRIYGGYAGNGNTGEPISYESGFALKWLVQQQIDGDAALNFDPAAGPAVAPLLLWGPYLWANGATPNGNGTSWLPADFESDTVHPSASGEAKVGALLSAFLATEPSATWLAPAAGAHLVRLLPRADAYVDAAQAASNFGAAGELRLAAGAQPQRSWIGFDNGAPFADLLHAKLVVRDVNTGLAPTLSLASNTSWSEASITHANQPAVDGGVIASGSNWTRENCPSFDVGNGLANDADGALSFVISTPAAGVQRLYSRETALSPLLIVSVRSDNDVFSDGFE